MLTIDVLYDALLERVSPRAEGRLEALRVGPFWSLVVTTMGSGLASSLRSEAHIHGSKPITDAGELHRKTPLELARLLRSESIPETAIGLAAVNALLGPPEGALTEHNAKEILAERGTGKRVAMIGHFPFADGLRARCSELWVFERGDGRRDGDHGAEMMDELLPQAEVVAITSTAIINRTLPEILDRVRPDAFVLMLGPSTPLTPLVFRLGIDVVCGTVITDARRVLRAVEQGAVTRQIGGVRKVCLWPE